MKIAIIAALCMVIQDILEIAKAQGAARNNGKIVAIADTLFWYVSITGTTLAAFTLHGGTLSSKIWVIILVSAANIVGNLLGTELGKRFIRDHSEESQDAKIQHLMERVEALEAK